MGSNSSPQSPYSGTRFDAHAQDNEQLNLLSIACTVVGILMALFFSFPLIHVAMGLLMVNGAFPTDPNGVSPALFGWFFVFFGGLFLLLGWLLAVLTIYMGRCLKKREKKTFIQVMAGILCFLLPVGTALGVFTFVVLSRPGVAAQFDSKTVSARF